MMEDKQEINASVANQQKKEEVVAQEIISTFTSQHYQEYCLLLGESNPSEEEIKQIAEELFKKEQIRYLPHHSNPKLTLEMFNHSPKFRIITLKAQISSFSMLLNVFIEDSDSPSHYLHSISRPTTSIFFPPKQTQSSIKCFAFTEDTPPSKIFSKAIKEYCLLKIASGLGVGPKCNPDKGFDLTIYNDCVQFSMECCLSTEQLSLDRFENEAIKLKKKLKLMHLFKLVHLDIKPDNIMLSPSLKELVYIDFGFSRILEEKSGFKSISNFFGTFPYCSPEMKKQLSTAIPSYIDLYFNDAHGLEVSLRQVREKIQNQIIPFDENEGINYDIEDMMIGKRISGKSYTYYRKIIQIKKAIYEKDRSVVFNSANRKIIVKNVHEFMSSLQQYPYCEFLAEIHDLFHEILKYQQKDRVNLQPKKETIFTNKEHHHPDDNPLQQKLQIIIKVSTSSVVYDCSETIKLKLLDETATVSNARKYQYFHYFMRIVDIRRADSTFEEKEKISNLFIKKLKVDRNQFYALSNFPSLQICLKYILNSCLDHPSEYFQWDIPATLINLTILQAFSQQQFIKFSIRSISLEAECSRYRMLIMLFRLHFALDWMAFKAVSTYIDIKLEMLIMFPLLSRIQHLEHRAQDRQIKTFIEIVNTLLVSRLRYVMYGQEKLTKMMNSLTSMREVQEETGEELKLLMVYYKQERNNVVGLENALISFVQLYQHQPLFLTEPTRVTQIHLRILAYLQKQNLYKPELEKKIYKTITTCLQEECIISTFKIFYTDDNFDEAEALKRVKLILNFCKDKKYQNSSQILNHLQRIVKRIKNEKTKQLIKCELRTVFNEEYLITIQFPENTYLRNIVYFYYNSSVVVRFFFDIYHISCPIIEHVRKFTQKLAQFHQTIICQECKENSYITLLDIQTYAYLMEDRISQIILILLGKMKQNVQRIEREEANKHRLLAVILASLTTIIYQIRSHNSPLHSNYDQEIYQVMKSQELIHIVFVGSNGEEVYKFLSYHLLKTTTDFQQYLRMHGQLLIFLQRYPSKDFVQFYHTRITNWSKTNNPHSKKVIVTYLQHFKQKLNPYCCILLAASLRQSADLESALLKQVACRICFHSISVAVSAKIIALEYFFSFIFRSGTIVKEKRQK